MADDAMCFLVDEGAGLVARDAGAALTGALPVASLTPTGGAPGLLPDLIGALLPRAVLYLPNDPSVADIPLGTARVAKNTTTGNTSLCVNDGGNFIRSPFIVSQSLGSPGYRKWSDGMIEQWGYVGAGGGDASVSFPIAFPNAVWAISATILNGNTNTNTLESVHLASVELSHFVGCPRFVFSGAAGQAGEPWFWQARGN